MEDLRIARRYAHSLFLTAEKYDLIRSVEDDLRGIDSVLAKDEEFKDFLLSPYTSREDKIAIIERLFSDRVTALTMQLLRVMLEKRREAEIPNIRQEFAALRREQAGVVHLHVVSAEMLPDGQRQALLKKMAGLLGHEVEAEFEIDPLLIGGIRVAFDGNVMDGSARGALNALRERLKYDLLRRIN